MFTPLLALIAASAAIAAPTARQGGLQVINNCYQNGQVALTYDDGVFQYEYNIADALNSVGGKATFFLNGNNYDCIYNHVQTIRDLSAQGHTLGSHTWSHKDLTTLQDWEIHQELERVEQAFIRILGLKPLYFRPPYGNYNGRVLNVLAQRGYKKVFLWSDDTGDSLGRSLDDQRGVMASVANSYPAPKMVLQHSVLSDSIDATWYGVNELRNRGYSLVAVDTCLGGAGEWPYEYIGQPQQQDGSWTC